MIHMGHLLRRRLGLPPVAAGLGQGGLDGRRRGQDLGRRQGVEPEALADLDIDRAERTGQAVERVGDGVAHVGDAAERRPDAVEHRNSGLWWGRAKRIDYYYYPRK